MLQANRLTMKICIVSFHHHSSNSIHTKLLYEEYMFEVCDISTGEAEAGGTHRHGASLSAGSAQERHPQWPLTTFPIQECIMNEPKNMIWFKSESLSSQVHVHV